MLYTSPDRDSNSQHQ